LPPVPFRLILATTLAFGLIAGPASAATLSPLKPCYVSAGRDEDDRETVTVSGTAFTPNTVLDVLIDGVLIGTAPTDPNGEFGFFTPAPFQKRGERAFTVTVRDGATALSVQSRVTRLAVFVRPRSAPPSRRVRFRGRGFMLAAPVYAHYVFGGREQKTVRLARRTTGACGKFRARRRQIPIDDPRTGRWIVQIDQHKDYSRKPDPVLVRLPIDVKEVFRED
jgi:hypothetical protein